jgi:protein-S-isoprenylcysteine O-methyltransferase Ste14
MTRDALTRWRVTAGYPLAVVCLALADPAPAWIAAGAAVGAVGLAIRAAAAGHLRKYERLATTGLYARTRNPLYLGSFFLAAGAAVAARSWWVAALVVGYLAAFYPAVMRREEDDLRARYGATFDAYARRVPRLFPRLWPRRAAQTASDAAAGANGEGSGFSWAQWRRNREYRAVIGFALTLAALALRMWLPWRL